MKYAGSNTIHMTLVRNFGLNKKEKKVLLEAAIKLSLADWNPFPVALCTDKAKITCSFSFPSLTCNRFWAICSPLLLFSGLKVVTKN